MADLTARIKPKKSSTAGEVPQASDLEVAELAVNTADGKLFVKHTDDSIKEISGGGGGGISTPDVGRYYDFPTKDTDTSPEVAGKWADRTNQLGLNKEDSNGVRLNYTQMLSLKTGTKVWFNFDNTGWVEKTLTTNTSYSSTGNGFYILTFGESVSSYTTIQFAIQDPTLQDGMELEYVAANTQWEHTYGGRPKSRFAVFEYDKDTSTPAPDFGLFAFWSGSNYAINQTDARGVFHGDRLLASSSSFNVKVYAGGALVYSGTITGLANVNSNRATFAFGSDAWVADLADGQLVEFYADTFDGGEYYANKGDVKVHDGTDFEARPLSTFDLADVSGAAANDNEILKYNSANGVYEPGLPLIEENSDFAFGKALLGSYTYSASSTSAPSTGLASDYSGSNWAINVIDQLGVNHQTALYAQTTSTNVDIYVDGVFQVSTTLSNFGNKNSNRCTFVVGDDTWKTGLTGGEVIEFHGEPFTFSEVATTDGQVLTWNNALSAYQPATPEMGDLSDVNPVSYAQGYQLTQGNFANPGEFTLNGSGLIFDVRSQNGLGNIPQPDNNGSLWFSTSEFGPFTELTIVGSVGLTGSFAYNIPDFVDRSALDAVLTGSTVIYWHTVDPAVDPADGQVLTYVAATGQWEPASTGIQTASDFELNAAAGTGPATRTLQPSNSNAVTSGGVGASIISAGYTYWAYGPDGSAAGTNFLTYLRDSASFPINVDINGTIVEVQAVANQADSGGNGGSLRLDHTGLTSTSQISGTSWTLAPETATTQPLIDGDILQWVAADSAFKPLALQGAAVRTILGIGEYVDDAAAGTGGVTSGALYYNTTSSDYRLKA